MVDISVLYLGSNTTCSLPVIPCSISDVSSLCGFSSTTDVTIWPEQGHGASTPLTPIKMFIKGFILAVSECIDSYQVYIDATSMHKLTSTHTRGQIDTSHTQAKLPHSSRLFMLLHPSITVISPADSGSDLRYCVTRGNHGDTDRITFRDVL